MSQEKPTPEELSEIEQFQYGAYGAEPPEWWIRQKAKPECVLTAEQWRVIAGQSGNSR